MTKEALTLLVHEMEYVLSCINENKVPFDGDDLHEALRLGKEALAQPEQEPVAWMLEGWGPDCGPYFEIYRNDEMGWRDKKEWTPLYTTPYVATPRPQRKPLTDEEIGAILEGVNAYGTRLYTFARAIEAVHGIKE